MNEMMDKALWRRGEVMDYLGVGWRTMKRMVATGVLTPRYIGRKKHRKGGGCRALFLRDEVMRVLGES